ncbi:MAG: ABC transporter permease [Oscillospiraceae bacterium]
MKFFNLFKKELREMLNSNMIASMIVCFVLFSVIGQAMTSSVNDLEEKSKSITICDLDSTDLTSNIIKSLEDYGYTVNQMYLTDYPNEVDISKQAEGKSVLIIPEGFTQSIESGSVATIKNVGTVENNSVMAQTQTYTYMDVINNVSAIVKDITMQKKNAFSSEELEFLDNPITLDEYTVVGEKSENISSGTISSILMSQSMFIPIIIFIIIVFASQMIVTAIATEKIDKTLETLLSTPISRVTVLSAKMLSAGLVSLINAVIYMLGLGTAMGSMFTNTSTETITTGFSTTQAMISLGLILKPLDYIIIGLNIFLSIMIALSLSMILGLFVNDIKSSQMVIMPVMFLAIIPYLISMLVDVSKLSPIAKVLLNLIPFTHTFNASNNLMFGNLNSVLIGLVYQVIVLIICMIILVKLFKSDRILTASLNFGKKKSLN